MLHWTKTSLHYVKNIKSLNIFGNFGLEWCVNKKNLTVEEEYQRLLKFNIYDSLKFIIPSIFHNSRTLYFCRSSLNSTIFIGTGGYTTDSIEYLLVFFTGKFFMANSACSIVLIIDFSLAVLSSNFGTLRQKRARK